MGEQDDEREREEARAGCRTWGVEVGDKGMKGVHLSLSFTFYLPLHLSHLSLLSFLVFILLFALFSLLSSLSSPAFLCPSLSPPFSRSLSLLLSLSLSSSLPFLALLYLIFLLPLLSAPIAPLPFCSFALVLAHPHTNRFPTSLPPSIPPQ